MKGYKYSLNVENKRTMCENLTFFEFLNVCSLAYLCTLGVAKLKSRFNSKNFFFWIIEKNVVDKVG
jgi:hypothetical protein